MRLGIFGLGLALLLQGSMWGPEQRLTNNLTIAETGLNNGALAVSSMGAVTAAWAERDGPNNNFRIYTKTRTGSLWQSQVLAVDFHDTYAGEVLGAKFPALVHVPGDSLVMVWHDYRVAGILNCELFTKTLPPGAAWGDSSSETRLTTSMHPETNGDNSLVPSLTLTPDGTAHVAWYDYRFDADYSEILFKSRTGGAWNLMPGDGPDTNVSNNSGESHFPSLVSGVDGVLHLAWRDNVLGSYQILYASRTPAGTWSPPVPLSPPGVPASGVCLAVSGDNTLGAVWSDSRSGGAAVYYRELPAGLSWSPPQRISPTNVGASTPVITIDSSGARHVVWDDARVSVFDRNIFLPNHLRGKRLGLHRCIGYKT